MTFLTDTIERARLPLAPPTAMIIFGASGDLNSRKLGPALYNLALDGLLPEKFFLMGYGRQTLSKEGFQDQTAAALRQFSRRPLDKTSWEKIAKNMSYHCGHYDSPEDFQTLAKRVHELETEVGEPLQLLFYLATPPSVFKPILKHLGSCGLAQQRRRTALASKIVIEKPFGRDLQSALDLNREIAVIFDEEQVFRIDHYLGKETVQDLLVQRFANAIFEPIWNRQYVECVQITVAESMGVGSRGGYYDASGALRDMIQNHTLQLLSLIAMEPPVSLRPEDIRGEKVKLLNAIQPLHLTGQSSDVVRAQYLSGKIGETPVPGYLEEEAIPLDSSTETYAALRLSINNWRWKGVPFYLRSGKRLKERISEVAVQFKRPPGILFGEGNQHSLAPNTMVMQIQPDEKVTLLLNSKKPGLETRPRSVQLHYAYETAFGSNTPEAYERLILDALHGDSTLFIRSDETEAAWRLVTPLLEHWQEQGKQDLSYYAAGSYGPDEAQQLLAVNNHEWRYLSD